MRTATMMLTKVLLLGSASVAGAEIEWVLWYSEPKRGVKKRRGGVAGMAGRGLPLLPYQHRPA